MLTKNNLVDAPSIGLQSRACHILLVDDNQGVVDVEKQMLERLGCKITATTESLKALAVFQTRPDDFDLVITDFSMPDLSGDQLIKNIMDVREDIPIILCTGFSDAIEADIHDCQNIKEVLQKPVSMAQFSDSIAKILGAEKTIK